LNSFLLLSTNSPDDRDRRYQGRSIASRKAARKDSPNSADNGRSEGGATRDFALPA
jgi:hypothetical protein